MIAAIALIIAAVAGQSWALAADRDSGWQGGATSSAAPDHLHLGKEKLKRFKAAYFWVQSIGRKYAPMIQGAGSNEKAQKIQREAQEKVETAVTKAGLTTREYGKIVSAMLRDPRLQRQVLQ